MDLLGRLLLRFLVVPFGILAAVVAVTIVAAVANWGKFMTLIASDPGTPPELAVPSLLLGVALITVQSVAVVVMLLPGLVGILVSEALAIRSWIFHALNGGLSIWVGWGAMAEFRRDYAFYDDPKIVIAAGLAGGFAYWAVAGWNAGFWKPVFRAERSPGRLDRPAHNETGREP